MQWKYKWLISKTFSLSIIFFHLIYCFLFTLHCFYCTFFFFDFTKQLQQTIKQKQPFLITKLAENWNILPNQTQQFLNKNIKVFLIFVKDILRIIKYVSSRFKVGDKRFISKQTRQLNVCVFIKCQSFKDRLDQNRQKKGNLSRPPTN